jgi:membrane protease YdiL (CAAX protease family)
MTSGAAEPPGDDRLAAALRGFGPLGIAAAIVIFAGNLVVVPLSALLALAWARRSRTPLRELGFVQPPGWLRAAAIGIAFGVVLKLLMKSAVMPLLDAPPVNPFYRYLAGNPAALPGMLYMVVVGAGFGEETLFRGYLFERLGKLLGTTAWARTASVLFSSALFGIAPHAGQGVAGVQQATIVGLVFGAIFAVTGRIWMLMFAHAAFDLTALALIYWSLEAKVARTFFG